MAREKVMKLHCDRCGRDEFLPEDTEKRTTDLEVTFMGKSVKYDDLCSACRKAVEGYFNQITKVMKNSSPKRMAKKKEGPTEVSPPSKTASKTSLVGQRP